MTATTEDNKEPRGGAAFAGEGPRRVNGREDVEEAELGDG